MARKFQLDSSQNTQTKEVISRTLEIVNQYAGELAIEVLSLDAIELDPENNRVLALTLHDAINGISETDPDYEKKKNDWKSLESLAKTIKDDQLINPILVYRYGNKCRLIAGERRTLASGIAGKKEIIARITNQRPVGTKLKVLQWIENNERVDLSLAERIASLEAIAKEYFSENKKTVDYSQITAKLMSSLTGMSMSQSRRYLLILQTRPEIKNAISEGRLENIKLVELICSVKNATHQKELLDAALMGLSFDAIVKLKNDLETHSTTSKEKRGRKKTNVSLGTVRPNIVKTIIEALISCEGIHAKIVDKINQINSDMRWDKPESVEKSFKKIVSILEGGVN